MIGLEGSVNFVKFNGVPSRCTLAHRGAVCGQDQPRALAG